jgi:ribonuclease Z
VSARELVVFGTASQVPTKRRNHNGYLLRWDGTGVLFDPGEGTQRQMTYMGVAASSVHRIAVTHFHGDHCLGLPGVIARLSLDRVPHPVTVHYPASGQEYLERLRYASIFHEAAELVEAPVTGDGPIAVTPAGTWSARALDHGVDAVGYRFEEPDGVRMRPDLLAARGVRGPDVGRLQRDGEITVDGHRVALTEVSAPRTGQKFAFVMDTRRCDAVYALADGVDMLVIESTYLDAQADLARDYGHMTAAQAAQVARDCGVRRLVLTHFSQRYDDAEAFVTEALTYFDGDVMIAADLTRIDVPRP